MPERPQDHPEYAQAYELMEAMVKTSQRPGEGNQRFVAELSDRLAGRGLDLETVADPDYPDRSLLVAHCGDPDGEQALATVSHSDVVGVEGQDQDWQTDPWELHERDDVWLGRGTCDTHGSGVAMLTAALRPEVQQELRDARAKASIIFTYDEEATSPEFSMRGARLAAGLLEVEPVVTGRFYIAGEPTEIGGEPVVMRGHKGRWLGHFTVDVEHSGHVSELVQNALEEGMQIVAEIQGYRRHLVYGSRFDVEAEIFTPPHSTIQVSAVDVKSGDYSTTPSHARFTVDMRTLPVADVHPWRVLEMQDLVESYADPDRGVTVTLRVEKDALGSMTPADSPIVRLAEDITGRPARGFNGGDEGRVMRLDAGKEGITIGPGELGYAHMPNEQVRIGSVLSAADLYASFFRRAAEMDAGRRA